MKIVTIIGARPQFVKAAIVSRQLRKEHEEIILHTGQHFDYNMSEIFFKELEIPKPNYNLGVSGGTHGKMTGEMLIKLETVLQKEKPDMVLIYGDTNSTMAGALAAVKLGIPICHIEAGIRIGNLKNPEEVNRVVADSVSSIFACCTDASVKNLLNEGKHKNVHLVGDPMLDAFKYYSEKVKNKNPEILIDLEKQIAIDIPDNFYYMTCHRQENTETDQALLEILLAMNSLEYKSIYPVHPRNKDRVLRLKKNYELDHIIFCNPVGYLMSVYLTLHAKKIVTDSGGLQREAFFAGKKCVTVFNYVSWPETMIGNRNQLTKANRYDILEKLNTDQIIDNNEMPFGDGHSAEKIVSIISKYKKEEVF